jgi:hypothetical protein
LTLPGPVESLPLPATFDKDFTQFGPPAQAD